MSILIKGMEMPPSCRYCEFRHMSLTQNAFCTAAHETIDYMAERTKRLDNCPLTEIPPHGRLIDADVLKKSLSTLLQFPSNLVNGQWIVNTIREQPTIIESEDK